MFRFRVRLRQLYWAVPEDTIVDDYTSLSTLSAEQRVPQCKLGLMNNLHAKMTELFAETRVLQLSRQWLVCSVTIVSLKYL